MKEGVHFLQEWYLLDLVKSAEGHVGGAVVWNMKEGRVEQIKAKAIILSTGGAGRIFWTRTTNPFLSTGDGMAAAFRAGNGLKDMEMIQFHPTGLGRTGILMSEAVRGEGGYLLNAEGERFMKKYAPNKMELASRDVVAKAIEDEIAAGRGFGSGLNAYVVADLRHLGPEVIIEKTSWYPRLSYVLRTLRSIDSTGTYSSYMSLYNGRYRRSGLQNLCM